MDDLKPDFGSDARIKLRFENEVHCPDFTAGRNYNVAQWRDSRLNVIVKDLLLEVQPQTIKCLTELLEDQKLDDGGKPVLFEVFMIIFHSTKFNPEYRKLTRKRSFADSHRQCPVIIQRGLHGPKRRLYGFTVGV